MSSARSMELHRFVEAIAEHGWAITPPVVPHGVIEELIAELAPVMRAQEGRGGIRNLLDIAPGVRALARSETVRGIAQGVLGPDCFAVRALLFDKTPNANWKVVWHQDLTIAVRERATLEGFGPWSEKEGVVHVQPPVRLLERMLAVRVHLDDCGPGSGPVRVITGSHRAGRMSGDMIDDWRSGHPVVDCLVPRGAILAFRPLILHASSPSATPAHRRVIHLEFSADDLPYPLEWHSRVSQHSAVVAATDALPLPRPMTRPEYPAARRSR